MKNPKYFICPMSKNIVDSVIELNSELFALIPTRRQIDFDGGYVNNWNTKSFYEYVKGKSNIIVQRDHAGPNQGKREDDGMESFEFDSKYFDIIHIDPWKLHNKNWSDGAKKTLEIIQTLNKLNPNLKYEICTEESIMYFSSSDILNILRYLKSNLNEDVYNKIEYVVIQSGVGLDLVNMKNTGNFNKERLKEMIGIVNSFGKKTILGVAHLVTELTGSGLFQTESPAHQRYKDLLIYTTHMRNIFTSIRDITDWSF